MLVDGSVGNLMQGVSQQPNRDRLPGQASVQENMVSDIVDGLRRRPGSTMRGEITLPPLSTRDGWYKHDTGTERYLVNFEGAPRVFTLSGVEQIVVASSTGYLTGVASKDIITTTIGDYTIVASKTEKPALTADVYAQTGEGAICYFTSAGEHKQVYSMTFPDSGIVISWEGYSINDGAAPSGAYSLDYALTQLVAAAEANATINAAYFFYIAGGSVRVVNQAGTDTINIRVDDGHGDSTCWVVQGFVDEIGKLPSMAAHGMVVAITGEGENATDDYYMKFFVNEGLTEAFGSAGTWRETAKVGLQYKLDEYTLPHVLVKYAGTYSAASFYFGPLDGSTLTTEIVLPSWGNREVGNDITNPIPGFVGKTISYLGNFQSRLVVFSGDTVMLSATDSYFNFWYKSGLSVIDDDVISGFSSDQRDNKLQYGIPHDKNFVAFTKTSQSIISGRSAVKPSNFNMPVTTSFTASGKTSPVSAGNVLFFPISYGGYAGVREFYTSSIESNDARAITEHVKRYIPGDISDMQVHPGLGLLLCRTEDKPRSIFVYQYAFSAGARIQSAWHEWTFKFDIDYITWVDEKLYYIAYSPLDKMFIGELDPTDNITVNEPYAPHIDLKQYGSPVEYPTDPEVTYLANFKTVLSDVTDYRCIQGTLGNLPGELLPLSGLDVDGKPVLTTYHTDAAFCGVNFDSRYDPSIPKILDYKDRVITTDRLTLSTFNLAYKDTGRFDVIVQSPFYEDTLQEFTGMSVGEFVLGTIPIVSGVFPAAVRRSAKDCVFSIQTDSHLPLVLTDIEWTAQYNKRGKRL